MLFAYRTEGQNLFRNSPEAPLGDALWIDVFQPSQSEVDALGELGITVPSREDMEEIEVSNRLYRDGDTEVLTVVLPGQDAQERQTVGPVAFILSETRLVTVRHHAPRPFQTFPTHAGQSSTGCSSVRHVFLGLIEEIVARLADHLEGIGHMLDKESHGLFLDPAPRSVALAEVLRAMGRQGEQIARLRQGLVTVERALSTFSVGLEGHGNMDLKQVSKAQLRDVQSLSVHSDFLSGRLAQLTDVAMGMINLEQSSASRILSVVATMFLPPTLVASVYGMNFPNLPGLEHPHGYLIASGLMIASVAGSLLLFKWMKWL